jgi:hypothetical protein
MGLRERHILRTYDGLDPTKRGRHMCGCGTLLPRVPRGPELDEEFQKHLSGIIDTDAISSNARLLGFERATALHSPHRHYPEWRFRPICLECSQGFTAGGDDPPSERVVHWPCKTAQALGLKDPLEEEKSDG